MSPRQRVAGSRGGTDREQPKPARRIGIEDLEEFCVAAMLTCGMRTGDARVTARALATTDSWGVFTHGTKSLRLYLARIRAGGIEATAVPQVVAEGTGWAKSAVSAGRPTEAATPETRAPAAQRKGRSERWQRS